MTKNITKFILLTITLLSFTFNVYAEKPQKQEHIAVHFGQESMQMITEMPDLQPTAADLAKKNHSLYYTLKPQTIYGLETRMRTFTFNEGKLCRIEFFFKDTSRENANKLLKEMFDFNGKTKPVFNADNSYMTFIGYIWEDKTIKTEYFYHYNKITNSSKLSISSTYKPLESND